MEKLQVLVAEHTNSAVQVEAEDNIFTLKQVDFDDVSVTKIELSPQEASEIMPHLKAFIDANPVTE